MMNILDGMMDVPTPVGTMPAYWAQPERAEPAPAVLVMMEGVGLNAYLRDVTRRLAAHGYVVMAPDPYWRGNGMGNVSRR